MRKLITFLLASFAPFFLWSQTIINGKITDVNSDENLIGANIMIVQSAEGTSSDVNGNFTLEISKDLGSKVQVEISYTGYTSKTFEVENNGQVTTLNFSIAADVLQLQDVIVSANKKTQSSQNVPMSISTLTAVLLRRNGSREFRDYASGIPNLSFGTQGAGLYGRFDNGISIRGISGRNTTAMYLDETPLPENIDPRLADVSRVEVLKGPQGTLYGSRNMGGAVRVITNQPNVKTVEGSVDMTFAKVKEGDFDFGTQGVLNIPLSSKSALRVVGFYDYDTGIFDRVINRDANILNTGTTLQTQLPDGTPFNIATDDCPNCDLTDKENIDNQINSGFQASIGFYPTDNISITPKIMVQNQYGEGYDFAEGEIGNFEQVRVSGVPEIYSDNWKHYSLTSAIKFGKGKLVSSTSFLDRKILEVDDDGESFSRLFELYDGEENLDFFSGNISKYNEATQFNQEIRFQSDLKGKLDFTVGAFYSLTK